MGRRSRPYPKPHRRFDRTFSIIQRLASRSDEKQLLFRAFPEDIAPLDMTEECLAYRQLPTVAVMRSRAKNSAPADAHRRSGTSHTLRGRFHISFVGCTH